MMSLKRYSRLAAVAVLGVIALCLTTGGLYLLRSELLSRGYEVPPAVSVVVFFALLGGVYGVFSQIALREARQLKAEDAS